MKRHPVCKWCGNPIAWYPTVNGKMIPIDAASASNGNIVIENGVAVVLKKADPRLHDDTIPRFISHHATCTKKPKPPTKA